MRAALLLILPACRADAPLGDSGEGPVQVTPLPDLVDEHAYLDRLVALEAVTLDAGGDRRASFAGEAAARAWAAGELVDLGWEVTEQTWSWGVPLRPHANLVAAWPGQSDDEVLVLAAHLDGVAGTPAVDDNGSGVVALLGVAEAIARREAPLARRVQLVLTTQEEFGMGGVRMWQAGLGPDEVAALRGFLVADMIGSPNGFPFVLDGAGFGGPGADGSAALSALLGEGIEAQGAPWELHEAIMNSDMGPVTDLGVPVGWVFGGTEEKTAAQAAAWGGEVGQPHDRCYHTPCDTVENVDLDLALVLTRAVAGATEAVATGEAL